MMRYDISRGRLGRKPGRWRPCIGNVIVAAFLLLLLLPVNPQAGSPSGRRTDRIPKSPPEDATAYSISQIFPLFPQPYTLAENGSATFQMLAREDQAASFLSSGNYAILQEQDRTLSVPISGTDYADGESSVSITHGWTYGWYGVPSGGSVTSESYYSSRSKLWRLLDTVATPSPEGSHYISDLFKVDNNASKAWIFWNNTRRSDMFSPVIEFWFRFGTIITTAAGTPLFAFGQVKDPVLLEAPAEEGMASYFRGPLFEFRAEGGTGTVTFAIRGGATLKTGLTAASFHHVRLQIENGTMTAFLDYQSVYNVSVPLHGMPDAFLYTTNEGACSLYVDAFDHSGDSGYFSNRNTYRNSSATFENITAGPVTLYFQYRSSKGNLYTTRPLSFECRLRDNTIFRNPSARIQEWTIDDVQNVTIGPQTSQSLLVSPGTHSLLVRRVVDGTILFNATVLFNKTGNFIAVPSQIANTRIVNGREQVSALSFHGFDENSTVPLPESGFQTVTPSGLQTGTLKRYPHVGLQRTYEHLPPSEDVIRDTRTDDEFSVSEYYLAGDGTNTSYWEYQSGVTLFGLNGSLPEAMTRGGGFEIGVPIRIMRIDTANRSDSALLVYGINQSTDFSTVTYDAAATTLFPDAVFLKRIVLPAYHSINDSFLDIRLFLSKNETRSRLFLLRAETGCRFYGFINFPAAPAEMRDLSLNFSAQENGRIALWSGGQVSVALGIVDGGEGDLLQLEAGFFGLSLAMPSISVYVNGSFLRELLPRVWNESGSFLVPLPNAGNRTLEISLEVPVPQAIDGFCIIRNVRILKGSSASLMTQIMLPPFGTDQIFLPPGPIVMEVRDKAGNLLDIRAEQINDTGEGGNTLITGTLGLTEVRLGLLSEAGDPVDFETCIIRAVFWSRGLLQNQTLTTPVIFSDPDSLVSVIVSDRVFGDVLLSRTFMAEQAIDLRLPVAALRIRSDILSPTVCLIARGSRTIRIDLLYEEIYTLVLPLGNYSLQYSDEQGTAKSIALGFDGQTLITLNSSGQAIWFNAYNSITGLQISTELVRLFLNGTPAPLAQPVRVFGTAVFAEIRDYFNRTLANATFSTAGRKEAALFIRMFEVTLMNGYSSPIRVEITQTGSPAGNLTVGLGPGAGVRVLLSAGLKFMFRAENASSGQLLEEKTAFLTQPRTLVFGYVSFEYDERDLGLIENPLGENLLISAIAMVLVLRPLSSGLPPAGAAIALGARRQPRPLRAGGPVPSHRGPVHLTPNPGLRPL